LILDSQTVSDLGSIYDRSIRTFAVKPRAFAIEPMAPSDIQATFFNGKL
jgi:hypothetical protein